MPRFITRIQLKDASANDYERLADEMKKESFRESGLPDKNDIYRLAEFEREGNISLADITGAAYRAARRTGKVSSFTVIKYKYINERIKHDIKQTVEHTAINTI